MLFRSVVRHYLGRIKPWNRRDLFSEQKQYNKYLKLTGWKKQADNNFMILLKKIKEHIVRRIQKIKKGKK